MNVCRVCLSKNPSKDISHLKTTKKEGNKNPFEIVQICLGIEINEDSMITTKLCSKCFQKIRTFYKFKLLALKNDASLRILCPEVSVKVEVVESEELVETVKRDHELLYDVAQDAADFESDNELLNSLKSFKSEEAEENTLSENITVQNLNVTELLLKNDKKCVEIIKNESETETAKASVASRKLKKPQRFRNKNNSGICEECGKAVANVKEHAVSHLPKQLKMRYPCKYPDCGKSYSTAGIRSKHYKRNHLVIKKTCDICNKDVFNLTQHVMQVHERERMPHACIMCGGRFISPSALEDHLTTHTKHEAHACEHCGKTFRLAVTMRNHIRAVHLKEKSHMCQYCSKSFFKKVHLQYHLRCHTKETPYQCKECGRAFKHSKTLQNHVLTHSTTKDFHCTQCSMSFVRRDYLRNHMISHTKIKKYPCKYCSVSFGRSDHRKRHEFTAHEKNMLAGPNGGALGRENKMAAESGGKNLADNDQNQTVLDKS